MRRSTAMPRAARAGKREIPASAMPMPASLYTAASASMRSADSGRPASSPPGDPVTTIWPASASRASDTESMPLTRGSPSRSRKTVRASSYAGGVNSNGGADNMRSAHARAVWPGAQPSAAAAPFTKLIAPRSIVSRPSPMRADW